MVGTAMNRLLPQMSEADVVSIADELLTIVLKSKHRGALENASIGLEMTCLLFFWVFCFPSVVNRVFQPRHCLLEEQPLGSIAAAKVAGARVEFRCKVDGNGSSKCWNSLRNLCDFAKRVERVQSSRQQYAARLGNHVQIAGGFGHSVFAGGRKRAARVVVLSSASASSQHFASHYSRLFSRRPVAALFGDALAHFAENVESQ